MSALILSRPSLKTYRLSDSWICYMIIVDQLLSQEVQIPLLLSCSEPGFRQGLGGDWRQIGDRLYSAGRKPGFERDKK